MISAYKYNSDCDPGDYLRTNIRREYDIDVIDICIKLLDKVNDNFECTMDDKDVIIVNDYTKAQVSKMIHDFTVNAKLNKINQSNLMNLLKKFAPNIDWPLHVTKDNKIESRINDYLRKDYRTISFDICPNPNNNCTIFVDKYKNEYFCTECGSSRFKHCYRCLTNVCGHSMSFREPNQRIYYRP